MRMICLDCGLTFGLDGPLAGCPACGSQDCEPASSDGESMQIKTIKDIMKEHGPDMDDEEDE